QGPPPPPRLVLLPRPAAAGGRQATVPLALLRARISQRLRDRDRGHGEARPFPELRGLPRALPARYVVSRACPAGPGVPHAGRFAHALPPHARSYRQVAVGPNRSSARGVFLRLE